MTDTTDIKALRELLCHEDLESNYHVGVTVTTLRLLLSKADQLEAERQRADANEPVRCEGVPQHVHDMIDPQETIDELRAELAELKGEQVPVEYQIYYHNHGTGGGAWCRVRTKACCEELQREHAGDNDFSFRTLFTAPQKPVVLPIDEMSYKDACEFVSINGMRNEDRPTLAMRAWNSCRKAAIEAAGGIVKDGELHIR